MTLRFRLNKPSLPLLCEYLAIEDTPSRTLIARKDERKRILHETRKKRTEL